MKNPFKMAKSKLLCELLALTSILASDGEFLGEIAAFDETEDDDLENFEEVSIGCAVNGVCNYNLFDVILNYLASFWSIKGWSLNVSILIRQSSQNISVF